MMTRRSLLASGAVLTVFPASAQLRRGPFRVGFLWAGTPWTPDSPLLRPFTEEIQRLGYVPGNNLAFEARSSEGDDKRLPDLAAELLALRPDVILVSSTPAVMALAKQRSTVPVVFVIGVDPVGRLGIAQSLSHPGGSFTGFFNNAGDVLPKSLQMLRDLLPQARRVGFLQDMTFGRAIGARVQSGDEYAERVGFELKTVEVNPGDDPTAVFDRLTGFEVEAFLATGGVYWSRNRRSLIELTRTRRLPSVFPFRMDAVDGALMTYGSDMDGLFRSAAGYVDRILQGANPADLPIQQATKLILVINMKTARELNLEIPQVLFANAAELIE
jgi:putative tryptophan/tyrosine transport system substrate-binding protein